MTIANIIGDKEMDPVTRDQLSRTVLDVGDHPGPNSISGTRIAGTSNRGEDTDD
jgi:hypothetical protein